MSAVLPLLPQLLLLPRPTLLTPPPLLSWRLLRPLLRPPPWPLLKPLRLLSLLLLPQTLLLLRLLQCHRSRLHCCHCSHAAIRSAAKPLTPSHRAAACSKRQRSGKTRRSEPGLARRCRRGHGH